MLLKRFPVRARAGLRPLLFTAVAGTCPVPAVAWACAQGQGAEQRPLPDARGPSTGPRTRKGRDRLSAAAKKRWAARREELRRTP
jgi:hypothetical protein